MNLGHAPQLSGVACHPSCVGLSRRAGLSV
jgi:hypothetical protein